MEQTENVSLSIPFLQKITEALPIDFAVVDRNNEIIDYGFHNFFSTNNDPINGLNLENIIPDYILGKTNLIDNIKRCIDAKKRINTDNFRIYSSVKDAECNLNITINPFEYEDDTFAILTFLDHTRNEDTKNEELEFQLDILQELGFYMVGTLDINRLLFLILTGITAGPALGFNRACILLVDKEMQNLVGVLGVGPTNAEEAGHIWSRLTIEKQSLRDFLTEYEYVEDKSSRPMTLQAAELTCNLKDKNNILVRTIEERHIFHQSLAEELNEKIHKEFYNAYNGIEFITIPLYCSDQTLGVIIADNRFNMKPISQKQIAQLRFFANLAGVTIQNAYRHHRLTESLKQTKSAMAMLEEANRSISDMEQYAAAGKMAGFVSHEIRNPLVTIGGFARSTLKNLDNLKKVKRNSYIIVNEVKRLEELLTEVLDYLRKPDPQLRKNNINDMVQETCEFFAETSMSQGIQIGCEVDSNIPEFPFDKKMMKQAIVNLLKNAIDISPHDSSIILQTSLGAGIVKIEIRDQGTGIKSEDKEKLFTPFFTTKDTGAGLGLSITKRIIAGHGGEITYCSECGKGTTVNITLPIC